MRSPVAAGFYPADAEELRNEVKNYLKSEKQLNALGVVAPHAGYMFSGSVAGEAFSTAKTDKRTFVLLGPNHTGHGSDIAISSEDWRTPLGIVKSDRELIKKLGIGIDESSHKYEHSLEVQLPFLQVLYKDFSIVPVCMSQLEFIELEDLAKLFPKSAFYVASSDFIHFGPMYGYEPVSGTIEQKLAWVMKSDAKLINLICKLEARKFYTAVLENSYTVCGFVPITLLMLIMKNIGAKKGNLIRYKTSYEVSPNSSFVSYAGIVFE